MSYLLGVTIGPVQSYIEESRKLSDLYNSSRIISDIMKEIFNYIVKNKNGEIIYPNHKDIQNIDYSNYMIFEISDSINLSNIKIKNNIYKKFNTIFNNEIKSEKIFFDIKEIFHLFWALEEIKDDNYFEAYKNLTHLISNLKNTYEFEQASEKGNKKCLICGKKNITNLSKDERKKYKLNKDEDLCPSCLFKRFYNNTDEKFKDNRLQSIYTIAIKNWKENIRKYLNENTKKLNKITKNLNELFKEEDKYYNPNEINNIINVLESESSSNHKNKKNINNKIEKIECEFNYNIKLIDNIEENIKKLKNIKDSLNSIYYNNEKEKIIQLPNYEYSFIQFDIDNLGCWISGKYLENTHDFKKYQKKLSNTLVKFGEKLKEKLKNTNCNVVYSGGDDFLGISPTEDITKVMTIIDKLFISEVKDKLKKYTSYCRQITYSTSITIAQCKDPMSYALSKTRKELENVKTRYENNEIEKNGVAINYIVNNGKEITCYLKKEDCQKLFQIIKNFEKVKSEISFSYIKNFENEFSAFNYNDLTFEQLRDFCKIAKSELKRLMLRSESKKKTDKADNYINDIVDFMFKIIHKNNTETTSNHENIDFKNIINIMKINKKLSVINFNNIEDGDNNEFN